MIGIRHEDKSKWEGRVPLVPEDVKQITDEHGIEFQVQMSPTRAFAAERYRTAGATIADNVAACPLILGVKEIPAECFEPNKTYVFFSHTIKAQPANMPALRRMAELGCTLIDYERIVDDEGRRLVFFGRYAGLAGMIDTLWSLGLRLQHEGIENPFILVQPAHYYDDLEHFKREFATVADEIREKGLPEQITPFVCGFAGYGQVSLGAQAIFDLLPASVVSPADLASVAADTKTCYKVVFHEEHLAKRIDASRPFDLQNTIHSPSFIELASSPTRST